MCAEVTIHHDPSTNVTEARLTPAASYSPELAQTIRDQVQPGTRLHISGARLGVRALVTADLLDFAPGRGTTGRVWSGAEDGPSQRQRGLTTGPLTEVTWEGGFPISDDDEPDDDEPDDDEPDDDEPDHD